MGTLCEGLDLHPTLTMKVLVLLLAAMMMLDLATPAPAEDEELQAEEVMLDLDAPVRMQDVEVKAEEVQAEDVQAEKVRQEDVPDNEDDPESNDPQPNDPEPTDAEPEDDRSEADLKCYIHGQCQEFTIDFQFSDDPDECGHYCRKKNKALDEDDIHKCNWWSWEPAQELCIMFHNCTTSADGKPSGLICPECISGMGDCPARECALAQKCKGVFIDSFEVENVQACISKCVETDVCEFYTFEKKQKHCVLYEDCYPDLVTNEFLPCDTCLTGERSCGLGYLGNTPADAGFVASTQGR